MKSLKFNNEIKLYLINKEMNNFSNDLLRKLILKRLKLKEKSKKIFLI